MDVLVADDQPEVRSALRLAIEQQAGLRIVGEAASVEEMILHLEAAHPDVVLMDWELPGPWVGGRPRSESRRLLSVMRRIRPGLAVVALSGRPEARSDAEACHADAFVSKGDPPGALLDAMRILRA